MPSYLAQNLEAMRRARHPGAASLAARCKAGGVAATLAPMPWPALPSGPLLLVGATAPEGVRAATEGREVWLWERSAPLLRAFLDAEDWTAAIRAGSLRCFCDVDLLTLAPPDGMSVVAHPLLAGRYAHELRWLTERPTRRALLVEGGLMVEEVARALWAEGVGVWTWETTRLPPAELTRIATALRPERILAINHHPGLPEAVEALAKAFPVRLDVWEIDPALEPVRPPATPVPHTTVHTWRRANVEVFRRAGYRADWLPLASDTEFRQPRTLTEAERAEVTASVCFVGRSMVLEARHFQRQLVERVARVRPGGLAAAQAIVERVVAEQRRTPEVWRMPAILAELIPELGPPQGREADPVMLAGEIAAAEFRLTVVANLGRYGVQVWGDEGWQGIVRHGVTWRGPAGHHAQVPRIYNNGGIHVDIGRLYQLDIVTLRVFDVLACGGFLLAQHNEELADLFVLGEELDTWRTIAELRTKIELYLMHPELRREIAARGRERVARHHTVHQRLRQMTGPTG